jgi:hypothetical protein
LLANPKEDDMASKQTRRSISVRGATYDTLRRFCVAHSRSMSDVVEEQLARLLADERPPRRTTANYVARAESGTPGRPAPTPARVVTKTKRSTKDDYRAISF